MKRNKQAFPALLAVIAAAILLAFAGCACLPARQSTQPPTIGEELCRAGCTNLGAEFYAHFDHTCVCQFRMPHFRQGEAEQPKDNPPKVQL